MTAETAPADIARDERQAPARPAAGPASHAAPAAGPGPTGRPGPVGKPSPVGRHAARPTPRASVSGLDAGNEERVTRHARPDGTDRPSGAAWPVKDPHAPANAPAPANRAPARPPWTSSGSAQVPPVFGDVGGPARSAGSAVPAVPPVPAAPPRPDPAPAAGDRVPAAADPVPEVAASLAGPDTAAPTRPDTAEPAGPVVGEPAGWDRQEPAAGGPRDRLPRRRQGPGRMWPWGWPQPPRRRLRRLRLRWPRYACPGQPDSLSVWPRPR